MTEYLDLNKALTEKGKREYIVVSDGTMYGKNDTVLATDTLIDLGLFIVPSRVIPDRISHEEVEKRKAEREQKEKFRRRKERMRAAKLHNP